MIIFDQLDGEEKANYRAINSISKRFVAHRIRVLSARADILLADSLQPSLALKSPSQYSIFRRLDKAKESAYKCLSGADGVERFLRYRFRMVIKSMDLEDGPWHI